jgi:2-polyprenyl-3-methyl-5-hydroxy-6-metoxy-1,4-benzoquinol methylase
MQHQLTVGDHRAKTECRRLARLLFGSGKRTISRVTEERPTQTDPTPTFTSAEWYDRSIDWSARVAREIPVLIDIFGPPGGGGILDAGCGTGHQACALARSGYRVVAADISNEMLEVARRHAVATGADVKFICSPYAAFHETLGGGFDGVYCLANSLAAAGTRDAVAQAVRHFAACLRFGARMFVQILNFDAMRNEIPCIRGPRVTNVDGCEYVSLRQFHFVEDGCQVTNMTIWRQSGWRYHAQGRTLYPITRDELRVWCRDCGLRIDAEWGSYAREPFDIARSADLILTATRI